MIIKRISKKDYQEVSNLIIDSFSKSEHGYSNESELVDKIRLEDGYNDSLELIALMDDIIVGHGLLSPVKIIDDKNEFIGLVLAPLSVLEKYQNQTIGSSLIVELEKEALKLDYNFISILGDPKYYGRFGYIEAKNYDILPPFEVPSEYFLVKEIKTDGLNNISGNLIYSDAFK